MIDPDFLDEEEQNEEENSSSEPEQVDEQPEVSAGYEDLASEEPANGLEASANLDGTDEVEEIEAAEAEGVVALEEGLDPESPAEVGVEERIEAEEQAIADVALGAMALGGVALLGEANARANDREARKREQEEARKAREEERARIAEERRQQAAQAAAAAAEARSNRPRPSFGESLRASEPAPAAPAPPTAFAAPPAPPAFGSDGATDDAPESEDGGTSDAGGAAAAAPAPPVRKPLERPGRTPAAAPHSPGAGAGGDERAEREAARKAALEAKKQADAAKKAEREAQMAERAAQRQSSFAGGAGARPRPAANHSSDFADLLGSSPAPAAPASPLASKYGNLTAKAVPDLAGALKTAQRESGPAPVAAPAAGAAAAPPPGSNDYLDIVQHLAARAAVHPEYDEIQKRYETRLLVGGEILQCTLVGLNAGLIDSVYRKLSEISDVLSRIEWKYVAIEPVLVVSEGGSRREIRIDPKQPVTIGREPSSTIPIGASFVSRQHAEIRNKVSNPHMPPKWVLHDLGSTHGTTINGSPVRESAPFGPEDRIELGRAYAATEYPTIQLINRAIPYGREDLNRMVVEVDLVIAVVEADREFEGQAALLKNLSDAQKMGGLLVLAVSKSGPIDDSMAANIDELRHAAHVLKGTEATRYLAAIDERDIHSYSPSAEEEPEDSDSEEEGGDEPFAPKSKPSREANWLDGVSKFIDGFRQRSHATVLEKRKKVTREEVVVAIRDTGTRLEAKLSKQLEDAERNLQRVSDEISMAPRNLGTAEILRDDAFKALKQTIDDDTNFFGDPLRPDSLTYFAEKLAKQLKMVKKGKTRVELFLVDPHAGQMPHQWINMELSRYAKQHFDRLLQQVTGPQKEPYGVMGLYQGLRELLGAHDKLRNTDLFSDDNYQRYTVTDLSRQLDQALSANFVEYEAVTSAKIDNIIMFVITKTRFAVMFYMSMFSIVGVVIGSTRSKLSQAMHGLFGADPTTGKKGYFFLFAIPILLVVVYMTVKSYRINTQDIIDEEIEKLRDQLTKHYQAVAKKFVDDAKRVFSIHLTSIESKIKQEMGTLGSSRMAATGLGTAKNPVLDQVTKDRDEIQQQIFQISQERAWAEQAQRQFTPSPFVQTAPARPGLRR